MPAPLNDDCDLELAELEGNSVPAPNHYRSQTNDETKPLAPSGETQPIDQRVCAQHFLHAITASLPMADLYFFFAKTEDDIDHILPVLIRLSMSLPLIAVVHTFVAGGYIPQSEVSTAHPIANHYITLPFLIYHAKVLT